MLSKPVLAPDPLRHWVDLELENLWGFRGEQINLTVYSSRDVQVEIFNPSRDLIYNQSWAGNESRLLPIGPAAPLGEYEIRGLIPNAPAYIWFNVVDNDNFSPTSFPYLRIHNNAEFWVFANRTFRTDYADKSFGFTLPDLPDAVSINCFNNSDIFVVRFTSEVVNVDVSLVFIHAGAKLILNGTMQGGFNSFRFPFFSPQQMQNWFSGIRIRTANRIGCEPTPLYFDWGDFERAGEHISYDPETHILTVFDVPESFFLDPIIGNNEIEADAESYPNYDEGNRFQVLDGAGNITSFSIYCRVTSGSHDIGVAIYNDSATEPDNLQWNSSRTISHTVARWENFTVSPQVTVANASYVHLLHNKEASVVVYQNDTEGEADPNSVYDFRTYAMPFLDPFPAHTNHAYMFSIYADYVVSGAQAFSYVMSETLAATGALVLGIERAFLDQNTGTITDSLIFGLAAIFANSNIVASGDSLVMLQEKVFVGDNPTLLTATSILGLEATYFTYVISETFLVTAEMVFTGVAELTLTAVLGIASLALILALCAFAYNVIGRAQKK